MSTSDKISLLLWLAGGFLFASVAIQISAHIIIKYHNHKENDND